MLHKAHFLRSLLETIAVGIVVVVIIAAMIVATESYPLATLGSG